MKYAKVFMCPGRHGLGQVCPGVCLCHWKVVMREGSVQKKLQNLCFGLKRAWALSSHPIHSDFKVNNLRPFSPK